MRAVLCKEFGPPESLVVEELPTPEIGDHQVLLDVKACGVNFPDLLIIENKYQFKPPLPFSPGGEVSGVVRKIGAKVTTLKPGDRVLGAPGSRGSPRRSRSMPATASRSPTACRLERRGGVPLHLRDLALRVAGPRRAEAGATPVLGAAGGVGLVAVELGKAMGARVIAAASSAEKIAVCREHGADEGIDYSTEDLKIASRRSRAGRALTWSTIRLVATSPRPRSARSHGKGASS
jgi:NADPH2:quinone reductase